MTLVKNIVKENMTASYVWIFNDLILTASINPFSKEPDITNIPEGNICLIDLLHVWDAKQQQKTGFEQ